MPEPSKEIKKGGERSNVRSTRTNKTIRSKTRDSLNLVISFVERSGKTRSN